MGDSQVKEKNGYNSWSAEESALLLELLVDAANRGWRDSSGVVNKLTVEKKILPILNEKLGCQKTFSMYQSRWKVFKQRYQKYADLMRFSSGFGWDPNTKKFTASDEVWKSYLESHPKHKYLKNDSFADYDDLRIVVGNGTATGRNSIGLGDETDAQIYEVDENNSHVSIENCAYDDFFGAYLPTQPDQLNNGTSFENHISSPRMMENPKETPSRNDGSKKRPRIQYEGSSSSKSVVEPELQGKISGGIDSISEIATDIRGMLKLMEKRERDRENNSLWNAIKEIQNLDNRTRYKAPAFIDKFGMKDAFVEMSVEEREEWIKYNVE